MDRLHSFNTDNPGIVSTKVSKYPTGNSKFEYLASPVNRKGRDSSLGLPINKNRR